MAYSTIIKPNTQMNTVLYTGTGSAQSITGVNFEPDFCWLKNRGTANHYLFDVVRGAEKNIHSNENYAEVTEATTLTSFNSDGFSLSTDADLNANGASVVSWNWKAGGTAVSNTDGSITSSVSVNTDAGFSVVKYTAPSGVSTIGHGLGVVPNVIMLKVLDEAGGWFFGMPELNGWQNRMILNTNGSSTTETRAFYANGSAPTNTVWATDQNSMGSPGDVVAYCFASVKGFSKFGSYVGNGNADGTFIYTGFKPAFIMIKPSSKVEAWTMLDNKRLGYNPDNNYLYANENYAEGTNERLDIVSNGFKIRSSTGEVNTDGATMIYMAFAENPLVANTSGGIPTTAR